MVSLHVSEKFRQLFENCRLNLDGVVNLLLDSSIPLSLRWDELHNELFDLGNDGLQVEERTASAFRLLFLLRLFLLFLLSLQLRGRFTLHDLQCTFFYNYLDTM